MAGGDGGAARTVGETDIAGEGAAETNLRTATRSESSMQAKVGVSTSISDEAAMAAPQHSAEVPGVDAHGRAVADVDSATSDANEARNVARDPSAAAGVRGEAALSAEASERRPDSVVEAEQRAASAKAAREASRNPDQLAEDKLEDAIDEKKAGAQAKVGVKVTTKPDGSDS
jgi:hypothetical protein